MSKIEELAQILANQIAAGEVVERPASVVKELVENAIDANSTQIDIFLEEAGLKTIQVIDNGDGIAEDDVLMAFKRHATSKIHSRDDLFRIKTLGFRGEALPSIASVSEITLETSTGESGSYVFLSGGDVKEHRPHSLRKGTSVTVSNLFFNTPARLKYVKTLNTELSNIGDIVNRLAMSHPNIAFRMVHEGNQMLRTTGSGDLKQTIAGIYGVATAKKMVHVSGEDLDFNINGYVSLPELTRAGRKYLSVIINGRYIKNIALNNSIVSGYGSKLMVGRFPLAVLTIEMDPLLVDVNVHPTKQEVRLSKEAELSALLQQVINKALSEQLLIPSVSDSQPFSKKVKTEQTVEQLELEPVTPDVQSDPIISSSGTGLGFDARTGDFFVQEKESLAPVSPVINETEEVVQEQRIVEKEVAPHTKDLSQHRPHFPDLAYFGQMHGTYLFAQNEEGLYIIDQHAAQERIKYEYYRQKLGEVSDDAQELLVPIVLEYTAEEVLRLNEKIGTLSEVGIHLESFGTNSFVVRSHPAWYPQGKEEETVREMVDLLLQTGKIDVGEFREKTAIMMSCKKSIKANHHLDDQQARALLDTLKTCDNPFNCPHGRPVLIHFTNGDMEKLFKRIQDSH